MLTYISIYIAGTVITYLILKDKRSIPNGLAIVWPLFIILFIFGALKGISDASNS